MHGWPFRRRPARPAPPPVTPLVFDGSFVWESSAHTQRRTDRVRDAQRDVDAKVAARAEYHPRARLAFDGVVAGQTAGWHLEDNLEHDRSLGTLRQMQTAAAVAREGAEKRLGKAKDARDLAWLNWREGYLRLGGDLPEDEEAPVAPSDPPVPPPDGRRRPWPQMIEPGPRDHRPEDDPENDTDNGWMVPLDGDPDDPADPDDPLPAEENR